MNTKDYVIKVIDKIKTRDNNEPEFIQAVEEVYTSLIPVLEQRPDLIKDNILERLSEPERMIIFKVPWVDDAGNIQVNRGFRVQFNSAIGPYKGGLRFAENVNLSIVKFLAFEQIFKNSLTGLPIGGGKGGSDFSPLNKSDAEIKRFTQSFMLELSRHIGGDIDSPAGDIGVGAREIGYLFGHYKRIKNSYDAAGVTGKSVAISGSILRPEATGYGIAYFAQEVLHEFNEDIKGKTIAVSGFGNVCWGFCKKAAALGAKVVTLSSEHGYIYDPEGVNTEAKLNYLLKMRADINGDLRDYAKEFNCEFFSNEKPWVRKVDLIVPCATQNELNLDDAKAIVNNKVKFVIEGSNMPITKEAMEYLKTHDVIVGPGKAANAGGVSVSALEMSQNVIRYSWTSEEVDQKLAGIMKNIYLSCKQAAQEYGYGYDLVAGANISGFLRVAEAMKIQGDY
ncbi:NADP-specific glutamate dehydrogenase [Erysipelotrichaceae bacterium OttesenSCG-928-M19]|nr:NADP-specific glutamate dehydrogenase [Erysipelotrichaceae bacterium OttesenSCG-928-M19]